MVHISLSVPSIFLISFIFMTKDFWWQKSYFNYTFGNKWNLNKNWIILHSWDESILTHEKLIVQSTKWFFYSLCFIHFIQTDVHICSGISTFDELFAKKKTANIFISTFQKITFIASKKQWLKIEALIPILVFYSLKL